MDQHFPFLAHEPNRIRCTPDINSYHQGRVPYPLTPRYLLAIISHRHGNFSFLLLLPAANDPRPWNKMLRGIIKGVPAVMWNEGCRDIEKKEFRNVLVYAYACLPKDIR